MSALKNGQSEACSGGACGTGTFHQRALAGPWASRASPHPPPARPPPRPTPPRAAASWGLLAPPSRPREACGASRSRAPGNTALPRNETLGETKGAALGLPQAAPGRGRPKLPSPTFPRSTGDSSPRADALAPALRRRRAAHPPPPGNLSLGRGGRGGYECACARDSRSTAHPRPLCTERPLPAARDT